MAEDAAGNMTKVPTDWWSADYDLAWDAWNRLVEVKAGENTVAAYEHDGLGRRITETGGGTTRHFYYSAAWQVLEERVGSSTGADRQFVWGVRYIDDLVLRDRDTSEPKNGVLNERLYALEDANFNVVALAETDGTIQERYMSSAYGMPWVVTGTFGSRESSAYGWEYRYTGRRYDLATGLYYYRSRPYHPDLGRFLSRDPIGYGAGDASLYRYVGNRPTSVTDPAGLDWPDSFTTTATQMKGWLIEVTQESTQGVRYVWNYPLPTPVPDWAREARFSSLIFAPGPAYERYQAGDPEYTITVGECYKEYNMLVLDVVLAACAVGKGGTMAPRMAGGLRAGRGKLPRLRTTPRVIYRKGRWNSVKDHTGRNLSFRDTLSEPIQPGKPGPLGKQPVFQPGKPYTAVDTSKLPPGSVVADGVPGSTVTPPGHVTVNASPEEIVRAAIPKPPKPPYGPGVSGKMPKIPKQ